MFYRVMELGNLSGTPLKQAQTEPNLKVGDELFIDGVFLPYPVTRFEYRPTADVTEDDVGFGPVRVAWPELQGSGQVSFRVEDVPVSALDDLEALLTDPRARRWLSWRGRRYRADGFEFTYEPDPDVPGMYVFNVECTVQRPYRALPPVPGTDVWPVLHLKHVGGGVRDRILHVAVHWPYMAVFHTAGVAVWDMDGGGKAVLAEPVAAGLGFFQTQPRLSLAKPEYVLPFKDGQGRLAVAWFDGERFFRATSRTDLAVGGVAQLSGRLLLADGPDGVYAFDPGLQRVAPFALGQRLNPAGSPLFLSPTAQPAAAYPAAADVRMVWPVGEERALVVTGGGFYLHAARAQGDGLEVLQRLSVVEEGLTLEAFGVFGAPRYPNGYWYAEVPQVHTVVAYGGSYQEKTRRSKLVSGFADRAVQWGNLVGIAFDGYAYFPYNERLVFRVEPLL